MIALVSFFGGSINSFSAEGEQRGSILREGLYEGADVSSLWV